LNVEDRDPLIRSVQTLLDTPGTALGEEMRRLARAHGDRAYSVLFRLLLDEELSPKEGRARFEEAERAAGSEQEGEETLDLRATLLVHSVRLGPSRSFRLLSGESYQRLVESSITDPLTGAYNRRFFQEVLYRELKRSKRYRLHLSVLLMDLDDFKSYNDANGHVAGDRALREVASLLRANCREIDTVCRYGGEEFVAILPATNKRGARTVGEKMRSRIAEHLFVGEESLPSKRLTLSGGISTFPEDGLTPEELVRSADQALYQAKSFTKNAVCYYYRDERRAFPRVDKAQPLRYRAGEGPWREAVTRDLSRGGLSITIADPPPLGGEIAMELLREGEPVRIEGRIVRVERYEGEERATVGVQFHRLDGETEERLGNL
jgi:diguanylate cyclase (GGDEF)-like protein